jgi:hypothetical protein
MQWCTAQWPPKDYCIAQRRSPVVKHNALAPSRCNDEELIVKVSAISPSATHESLSGFAETA